MRRLFAALLLLGHMAACTTKEAATPPVSGVATDTPSPTQVSQPPLAAPTPAHPDWVGAVIHIDGTTESIIVRLTEVGGTLTIQPHTQTLTIGDVQRDETTLSFNVTGPREMRFAGKLEGAQIMGEVEQAGQTDSFVLLPLWPGANSALADFAGTYQFASGETLIIAISPSFTLAGLDYFWSGLTLTHFGTGAIRGLYPIAMDTFLVGNARVLGYPFAAQITFLRDDLGNVTHLVWQRRESVTGMLANGEKAERLALPTETVRYTSADGVTLVGQLTRPATPGPYPAIVVLHGSERGARNDFFRQQLSVFMASRGIAVLTFDKRGVGDSGGTYRESASESNLALLAQDALAGVNYLKGRPEIDGDHIGLIGSSQSGWIIPLASAQSDDISFFAILSGPVVSVGLEDAYSAYTHNGSSPTQYTAEEISKKLALVSPSGFDPVPVMATLEQPGLWLWGGQDQSVPVPESLKNLQDLVAQGKSGFTYHIFPNADHNLQQTTQGLFAEIPYSSGFPEGFFATLADWLQAQVQRAAR